MQAMEFTYGKTQYLMSRRMQRHPQLAKLIYQVFGPTNVGNYARAEVFGRMLKQLPVDEFQEILDLGCGQGEYSFMLSEGLPGTTVTALDINGDNLQRIQEVAQGEGLDNLRIHHGKIETLPPERRFDFIFSIDVFEHIPPAEMPFAEAYRRLRPGGYLLVKIPSREQRTILPEHWFEDHQEWLEDEHVGQVYNLEGLRQRMYQEGFEIIHAAYDDGWWSRLGWEIGYLSRQGGSIAQLLFLPPAKACVHLDRLVHNRSWGNTIQVIGKKKA